MERMAQPRELLYLGVERPKSDLIFKSLPEEGWRVYPATTIPQAAEILSREQVRVGVVRFEPQGTGTIADLRLLGGLEDLLQSAKGVEWVALIPRAQTECAALARIVGTWFHDYHTLPVDEGRLCCSLGHALGMARLRRDQLPSPIRSEDLRELEMVGCSAPMKTLFKDIRKVASVDAPVLITGESGVGKELVAEAIHERSARRGAPFVAVDCGALPSGLIQSELFGHEKGAFTGAHQRKIGRIEAAAGGTVFLDEIGDLPLDLQSNLLRFLQEKTINRVGGREQVVVDARVIAATHVDLHKAVEEGRFRQDLFYRLNVLYLPVPALRERPGDVELLARFFFDKFAAEKRCSVKGFLREAIQVMNCHDWPGNARELINRVRRAVVMCEGRLITPADLGLERRARPRVTQTLEQVTERAEREAISAALCRTHNNVAEAARELGVSRATLYRLLERHRISKPPDELKVAAQ